MLKNSSEKSRNDDDTSSSNVGLLVESLDSKWWCYWRCLHLLWSIQCNSSPQMAMYSMSLSQKTNTVTSTTLKFVNPKRGKSEGGNGNSGGHRNLHPTHELCVPHQVILWFVGRSVWWYAKPK